MPETKGSHRVTLIEGDGIGPEVVGAAVRVLEAAGARVEWEPVLVGEKAREEYGVLLPEPALESIRRNGAGLKGPITTSIGEGIPSLNVRLRKELDLYACVRPVRSLPGVSAPYLDVDLVIVRENTEDLYAGIEHETVPGVVESLKVITRVASLRIARFGFEYAVREGFSHVTAVHKANIMKLSDGLFLNCCREVAAAYPALRYDEVIVDNACHQLVVRPQQFSVLVMPNLYRDIISDLGAGLVGGIGLVPGANVGDSAAVFEPVHGSWPQAAGQGIANRTAMIRTAALLLRYLGEAATSGRVERAVVATLGEGRVLTRDLGGQAGTADFTDAVIAHLG
ncbi:MAG: NAD-dependent isocitrate dehydrogenase [Chloroflexi bacterium]|nr:NAD-dependent isocitrate dehydrogenase [Chloroflexota bacterium]